MQPGLHRAIPMAIIGFVLAALVVIILRGLQQLDPLWAPGPGFVLSAFVSAGFFVWGMGAFDPKMSVHGEHAEEAHHEEETPKPTTILSSSIWTLFTYLLIALVPLMLFAVFGGLNLKTTEDALASRTAVGYFPVEWFGRELLISELVVLAALVFAMFATLAVVAGGLGWVFVYLARTIAEAKAAPNAPINAPALPSGGSGAGGAAVIAQVPEERRIRPVHIVTFLILFVLLYLLFYYVLVGLALPAFVSPSAEIFGQPAIVVVNVVISALNALVFAFLLVRPTLLLILVGRFAGWLARLLRRVPVLFQR